MSDSCVVLDVLDKQMGHIRNSITALQVVLEDAGGFDIESKRKAVIRSNAELCILAQQALALVAIGLDPGGIEQLLQQIAENMPLAVEEITYAYGAPKH